MMNRELSPREAELLRMIRPTTFQDIVDEVRKDVDQSRFNAKRELKNLKNGSGNDHDDNGDRNGNGNGHDTDNGNGNGNSKGKKLNNT